MDKINFIEVKGEMDYDYVNDILFFKIKNREYSHSIELSNYTIDIDNKGFVSGLQIFSASKTFEIPKQALRNVNQWKLKVVVLNGIIEIKLDFLALLRNQEIKIKPIITEKIKEKIPNSEILCTI